MPFLRRCLHSCYGFTALELRESLYIHTSAEVHQRMRITLTLVLWRERITAAAGRSGEGACRENKSTFHVGALSIRLLFAFTDCRNISYRTQSRP